ncbi:MAG: TIGR04552 family protein [Bdellovibrionota bacterium]
MVKPHDLNFDWDALWATTEGRSYVDVQKLNVTSKNEAKKFLLAYGYDIDDLHVREEIWRIYFEAVAFMRNALLDPGEEIPVAFLSRNQQSDVVKLILEASRQSAEASSRWSCALLRVMHIISHLDNDVRYDNFRYAREQIFDRFDALMTKRDQGRQGEFTSGGQSVQLVRYFRKERKDRNSTLVKLLSKPKAAVEAIYDRIGFRFVTETKWDAFQLIRLLTDSGVLSPPNIHPQRSFNTILPTEQFRDFVEDLRHKMKDKGISEAEAAHAVRALEREGGVSLGTARNRFTSSWYRAIQFTCRQLIVAPDPTFTFWEGVRAEIVKHPGMEDILRNIPITLREKRTFYYPFEIQILDKESYIESIGGRSRHREYKTRQRLMARNRVLRDLF